MIKGLDHGNHYTKDNDMHIFKSAFTRSDSSLSEQNKIIIDGNIYYFDKGNNSVNADTINAEINKVCTLANLAMSGDDDYYLVVGLPINQYASRRNDFYNLIMSYNKCEVIYQNKKLNYSIKDATVFAQGAGILFNYPIPDGYYICFDVGSYTINVVLVELINKIPHIIKFNTWFDGMLTLYHSIIDYINGISPTTLDYSDAQRILKDGLSISGNKVDVSYINNIKHDYLSNILTKLKLAYPNYLTIPILICGGGGEFLHEMIETQLHNSILMPDSQFANAMGYYQFGLQKYERKEVFYG